ncbi:MAG TPA: hypothetical protein VFP80_12370 [Thermoanaerobaculia bacterium]|nr:hypothetical protein [Thermoanaerobaculia bacterium]
MSEVASANQAELASEIRKLSSYLEGIPPALRERGLFEAYETRLQDLEEQLVALRLSSISPRESSVPDGSPAPTIRDQNSLNAWVGHLAEIEREHTRVANRLARRLHWIHAAAVALSIVVVVFALNSLHVSTAAAAGVVVVLELAASFTRVTDRIQNEQALALRADLLRQELEMPERHTENTTLDDRTRRKILQLLDEGASLHTKG